MKRRWFFLLLFLCVLLLKLCHWRLLWPDEDYHLAAANQLLHGKLFYRDFWYDKPPLSALAYALLGAPTGWPLRLFDAVYVTAICLAAFRLAETWWSRREGFLAAFGIAFFLCFDFLPAVTPIAPDFFMILPHLLAILCASEKRPLLAGFWCALAFLFNSKALVVLAACALFSPSVWLLIGFVPAIAGAIPDVWIWGAAYASHPLRGDFARRILDWFGFHAALGIGFVAFWTRERNWKIAAWAVLSFVAVVSGPQLPPRYFLQLLPVLVIAGARGLSRTNWRIFAAIALLVPLIRFGPRYVTVALDKPWNDTLLDRDSREVADWILANGQNSDTLFVWGYRPDIFAFTKLQTAGMFWDSQPLTGVPADRHLFDSKPVMDGSANRGTTEKTKPVWIVESPSRLSIRQYPELARWMESYREVRRTKLTTIYRRLPGAP